MELNATDRQVLAKLREGRCTPRYLADELSRDKSYISQRLKRLREEEYVVRIHRGLYKHARIEERTISAAKRPSP
ncbi:MarR family transcriptional regulator [Natrialba swarupiae]|nr:MarR family transcriptional regulator [Natrialba swarupiae]